MWQLGWEAKLSEYRAHTPNLNAPLTLFSPKIMEMLQMLSGFDYRISNQIYLQAVNLY